MGSKKVTIGYRYYLGVQMVIARAADSISRIIIGDRKAWEGMVVANQTIPILKYDLFGGDGTGGQGGVAGNVDIEFGGEAQTPNAYVQEQVGGPIPAYRRKVSMTFRGFPGDHSFYWASFNPFVKPVAVTMTRILSGWGQTRFEEVTEVAADKVYPWIGDAYDPRHPDGNFEYTGGGIGFQSSLQVALDALSDQMGYGQPYQYLMGWENNDGAFYDGADGVYVGEDPNTPGAAYHYMALHYSIEPNPNGYVNYLTGLSVCAMHNNPAIAGAYVTGRNSSFGTFPPGNQITNGFVGSELFPWDGVGGPGKPAAPAPWFDLRASCGDGSGNYVLYGHTSRIITVRRLPSPPELPGSDLPDWPPDPTNFWWDPETGQTYSKQPFTQVAGSYLWLSTYVFSQGGVVSSLPFGPVLTVGDAASTEAYWTAQYNAAVLAGNLPAGYTYNAAGTGGAGTYPRLQSYAWTRTYQQPLPGEVWYPDCIAIPRPNASTILLRTELVDLDAVTNAALDEDGAAAVGVSISNVQRTDILSITPNLIGEYTAWAPWGVPALSGPETGSSYRYHILQNDDPDTDTAYGPVGLYNGYAAARTAAINAGAEIVTGAEQYRFFIEDSFIEDNTGGLSLKVEIYRPLQPDMNPAHIIYQCLTEPEYGVGVPVELIHDESFRAAADQLCAENFGLSFIWTRQEPVEDFINIVLGHINAALYQDRSDGKFRLKLVRDDYDPETLDIYDESNIVDVESFGRVAWGETINEIVVGYTNPDNEKESTVSVQNLANIQLQGGVVTSKRSYAGIRYADLAFRVAQRDLKIASTPLASARLVVNRSAWNVPPGGVFKLSWVDYDIASVIFRVTGIDYGTISDPTITIDCVEDVFGLPDSSYGVEQPPTWVDPAQPATDVGALKITEASYHEVFNQLSDPEIAELDGTEAFLVGLASKGAGSNKGFSIWTGATDVEDDALLYGDTDATPTATLQEDIDQLATEFEYSTIIGGFISEIVPGYAYIDDELIWIESIDTETMLMTVRRGIHDTVPTTHSSGATIWFWNGLTGETGALAFFGGHVEDELIYVWAPGRTVGDAQALADAVETTYTGVARWSRPWPPANVQIDGQYWPTGFFDAPFDLTWVGRNRLQQTTEGEAGAIAWTEGSIDPEAGATYTLRLVDDDTDTVLTTVTGLTLLDSPYTIDPADYAASRLRIELTSALAGRESYQQFSHVVTTGAFRETEDGFTRETEDGLRRDLDD